MILLLYYKNDAQRGLEGRLAIYKIKAKQIQ